METIVPADPVKLAISHLDGAYPWSVTVTKNRPNPTTGRVVTVRRSGGLRPDMVTDGAWLSIECFAASDEDASDLCHYTWGLLFAMKDEIVGGVQCYEVTAIAAPNDFPSVEPGTGSSKPRFVCSVSAEFRATSVA